MKLKEAQRYYYNKQVQSSLPPNGPGSIDNFLIKEGTIDFINGLISNYNIETISDCPSGVYGNWMHLLELHKREIKYTGYDINDLVVDRNKKEFPNVSFVEFNMCEEILPESDLIICRDCLFHLPNDFVIQTLKNFKNSNSTYLLATEQRWLEKNYELSSKELDMECGFKPINLEIEPFNLGEPLLYHNEQVKNKKERNIGLWKIN